MQRLRPMPMMVQVVLVVALLTGAGFGVGTIARAQDGTPEAVIDPVDVAHPAHVHTGSCDELGDVVEPLSDLTVTQGDPVGMAGAIGTSRSFTNVPIAFEALLAGAHALNVHLSAQAIDTYIACGDIGGVVDAGGALTIGLKEVDVSGYTGIAYLAAGADEASTDILIFMTEDDSTTDPIAGATPVAGAGTEAVVAAPTSVPTEVSTEETVEVALTEWAINMPSELEAGTVIFEVINDGTVPHTFQISGSSLDTALAAPIGPGETATLTVDLTPGIYVVFCPLGDGAHREIGMQLEVTVN